jgi:hypothetical protein
MRALRALLRRRRTLGIDWRVVVPTGDAAEYGIISRTVYAFGAFFALTQHTVSTGGTNPSANVYLRAIRSTDGVAWTTVATLLSGTQGISPINNQPYGMTNTFQEGVFSETTLSFIGRSTQESPTAPSTSVGVNISTTDGTNWNVSQSAPITSRDVAFGNGAWLVKLGDLLNPLIYADLTRSTDFVNYTVVRTNSRSIAFGNGVFVETNLNAPLSYSVDGATWTQSPFFNAFTPPFVSFAGGKFWAAVLGTPLRLFSSTDGAFWTEVIVPTTEADRVYKMGSANGAFLFYGLYYPGQEGLDPVSFSFYSKSGTRFIDISQSVPLSTLGPNNDGPFFVRSLGYGTYLGVNYNRVGISP